MKQYVVNWQTSPIIKIIANWITEILNCWSDKKEEVSLDCHDGFYDLL